MAGRLKTAVTDAMDGLLRSYAQVLFSRSRRVGLVLLATSFLVPSVGLCGVVAGATALLTARAMGLSAVARSEGLFSYNAVLVGLGVGATSAIAPAMLGLAAAGAVLAVVLSAALDRLLSTRLALPQLSVGFQLALWLTAAAAPALGLTFDHPTFAAPILDAPLPPMLTHSLEALGALFFLPRWDAGLLVFAALLLHSRIGAALAMLGIATAGVGAAMTAGTLGTSLHGVLAFNLALTAIALGGTWFVPGGASVLLAVGGCLIAGLLTLGLAPPLAALGLPVRVLPFNLAVLTVLVAMRLRDRDRAPKSVDFLLGTPEENLRTWRTRVARFGSQYLARFHAPFRGRWSVTQGIEGPHTHKGAWRDAADFEVLDGEQRTVAGEGHANEDFHCWRLPVVACADGTVAAVVEGVADLPPNEVDLADNWGNAVVLWHGGVVWSMVAHLSAGSTRVRVGQAVKQGETLGLCGASGRAPSPHLHFQLQGAPQPGSPTLPLELHDVVRSRGDQQELVATCVPQIGDTLRSIDPQEDVARALRFRPDLAQRFRLTTDDAETGPEFDLLHQIDVLGRSTLHIQRGDADPTATLYYEAGPRLFVVFDILGRRGTPLDLIRLALARVPLEVSPRLTWTDHVPTPLLRSSWVQTLMNPFWPLGAGPGERIEYASVRVGAEIVVSGTSTRRLPDGSAVLTTRAVLSPTTGIEEIEITTRGRRRRLTRVTP